MVKCEKAHIQDYSNDDEKRRCVTIGSNTLKRMNSCVLFIKLRNNSTTKLKQLERVFFVIVLKSATLEQGEFVEMRGSIVMSTFNNCKVCVGGVMLVILR
jgi:hypothetical protein